MKKFILHPSSFILHLLAFILLLSSAQADIGLRWDPNPLADGVHHYNVYRAEDAATTFTLQRPTTLTIATKFLPGRIPIQTRQVLATAASPTSPTLALRTPRFTDTDYPPGATLYYYTTAVDAYGNESGPSPIIGCLAPVPTPPRPPSRPIIILGLVNIFTGRLHE